MRVPALILALVPVLSLSACSDRAGEVDPGFRGLEVEQSAIVPTVFAVRWETDLAVESFVRFAEHGTSMIFETPASEAAVEHEGILVGVPEATEGWFELVALHEGQEHRSTRYEFTTGGLRPEVPRSQTTLGDSSHATPGLILAPVGLDSSRWAALMDHHGRLVWAWGDEDTDTQRVRLTRDGRGVVLIDRIPGSIDLELVRVDFFGDEVWRIPVAEAHHDFELISDESFLFIGYDVREVELASGPREIIGDQIFQLDLDGVRTPIWSVWDHVEFTSKTSASESMELAGALGWTHGNYLYYDRDHDRILTTMRDIDMAFAIDRPSGEVLWSLGGEQGEYQSPDDSPVLNYPHSIWPTDTGYTVFNQGQILDPDCSWAAHLELDEGSRAAVETWAYTSPTCQQTFYVGNAQPLDEDRTLVSFGKAGVLDEISTETGETIVRHSLEIPGEFLYVEHVGALYPGSR